MLLVISIFFFSVTHDPLEKSVSFGSPCDNINQTLAHRKSLEGARKGPGYGGLWFIGYKVLT